MSDKKIVVIGIGNVLRTDDGLGVHAVEKLKKEYSFPDNVDIYDGGTTGVALLPYIREADHLVVIDAINGDDPPGTIYRLSLEDFKQRLPKKMSMHDVGFVECLAMTEIAEDTPESVVAIGAKPEETGVDSMTMTDTLTNKLGEISEMVVKELLLLGAKCEKIT